MHGRIGWAPWTAEEEDMICIFNGMETVVRRNGDSQDVYALMGECFISGLMAEEAMGTGLSICDN